MANVFRNILKGVCKMKKILISLFVITIATLHTSAATWVAADRVDRVGKTIIEKNNLPAKTTFKVVNGAADNSNVSTTNIIQISSTDLSYTGNDSEVASVIANTMGQIINGKDGKDKFRNLAKAALADKLSSDNVVNTAINSEFVENKTTLADNKDADITGIDLLVKTPYNPLAMIVVITKMPGSTWEILQGKPANSERAMNVFDYMTYTYPEKVKAGYGCQEYRAFLAYAEPIAIDRNSNKKKLAKFNKEQEKNKLLRAKNIEKYKATGGLNGWDATYTILKSLTE